MCLNLEILKNTYLRGREKEEWEVKQKGGRVYCKLSLDKRKNYGIGTLRLKLKKRTRQEQSNVARREKETPLAKKRWSSHRWSWVPILPYWVITHIIQNKGILTFAFPPCSLRTYLWCNKQWFMTARMLQTIYFSLDQ